MLYSFKTGSLNEEFKAKSFITDGLDLSFLKTIQNQIENISRRLKELEQR